MKPAEKVKEIYNNGQDVICLMKIYKNYLDNYVVDIYYEYDSEKETICKTETIGFYEWLINPKYGVLEVFSFFIDFMNNNYMKLSSTKKLNVRVKNIPEEILNYLAGRS
jgi:hypothetical protein